MPRSKLVFNEDNVEVALITNFKILTTDVLHDFRYIYKVLSENLHDSILESAYNELLGKHKKLLRMKKCSLQYKTRVYIIAKIDVPMLIEFILMRTTINTISFFGFALVLLGALGITANSKNVQ